ncbi:hypothetical protein EJ07DRAFT_50795, partial [Lizonia empirigonia]
MPKPTGPLAEQLPASPSPTSTTDTTPSAANKLGANKSTNAMPNANPSVLSSAGAIGKHFNPDGALGSIGQAVGGPFAKDGVVGSQFDAGKDSIAGRVERAVGGPSKPAGSGK